MLMEQPGSSSSFLAIGMHAIANSTSHWISNPHPCRITTITSVSTVACQLHYEHVSPAAILNNANLELAALLCAALHEHRTSS